jgi:uncharacterized protein (TIGR04255 family)
MNHFPIPIPERLPVRIDPCPIVEAAVEMRFVSSEPWRNMPGLLAPRLRKRYPESKELRLFQLPEAIRQQEAGFTYQPLVKYDGADFLIHFGPRVLTLNTRMQQYPGWPRIREELLWLWKEVADAGFVQEGERLGVRYIDFFAEDIFSLVVLQASVGGQEIVGVEQNFSVVAPWDNATARLVLTNGAFLNDGHEKRRGSVLDLEVWQALTSDDVFAGARMQVERLHEANKKLFFGLLKPDFLASLNPTYP